MDTGIITLTNMHEIKTISFIIFTIYALTFVLPSSSLQLTYILAPIEIKSISINQTVNNVTEPNNILHYDLIVILKKMDPVELEKLILKLNGQAQITRILENINVLILKLQQPVSEKEVIGILEEDPNVMSVSVERSISVTN